MMNSQKIALMINVDKESLQKTIASKSFLSSFRDFYFLGVGGVGGLGVQVLAYLPEIISPVTFVTLFLHFLTRFKGGQMSWCGG